MFLIGFLWIKKILYKKVLFIKYSYLLAFLLKTGKPAYWMQYKSSVYGINISTNNLISSPQIFFTASSSN